MSVVLLSYLHYLEGVLEKVDVGVFGEGVFECYLYVFGLKRDNFDLICEVRNRGETLAGS